MTYPGQSDAQEDKLITKARKDENTKKIKVKFRAFYISCFRDEKKIENAAK